MGDLSPLENDEMSEYDIYGKTPPRTKILRKNRERKIKHEHKHEHPKQHKEGMSLPKANKIKQIRRRNTVGSMYEESGSAIENTELEQGPGHKRINKRDMKRLRGSERDLKLDIASAQAINHERFPVDQVNEQEYPRTPGYHIESNKRFMSLSCRTFPCRQEKLNKNKALGDEKVENCLVNIEENLSKDCPESRVEFYHTLRSLIRMGSGEKHCDRGHHRRVLSREETMWRNEFKDIIWLELQAYHADRSPMEEDSYLCNEREKVEPLLNDIKYYRFQRQSRRYSTQNSDSGVEDDCSGCLSIFCHSCLEAQNEAIRDIEKLLGRLEEVESLFSSSKAFAELYPLYHCPEIAGRIKAMCLWLNMTKHQRLKLNILGKMLDNKDGEWGITNEENGMSSPSDSNSSTNSTISDCFNNRNIDLYNITPITSLLAKKDGSKISPYRRYIQNILKTRALNKSLNFLKNLHQHLLKKTQLTLELCENSNIFNKTCSDTEEEELRRYGTWSPEAQSLNLPSYRSMFIFLAMVPLEVVNEYLKMRLEQKPEKPSPLSVRQLMRELKEGLQVTIGERQRACEYIESATSGIKGCSDTFWERIHSVDNCLICVFKDYLDYLGQWVLLNKNKFPKNLLEEEYEFCQEISKYVIDGKDLTSKKFIFILGTILKRIGERLLMRIEEILETISQCEEGTLKQNLFSVCRELQQLFNEEREMSIKALAFIKSHLRYITKDNMYPEKTLIEAIVAYKCIIPTAIAKVQGLFDHISIASLDDLDKNALNSRIREILMQVYRFGFEFYREMSDTTAPEFRGRLVLSMVNFANLWMKFVTERCERGRGMRPRWAYQGMEFLLTVCEPVNTQYLSEELFESLKKDMDICISHVIGTAAPSTPDSGFYSSCSRTSLDQIRARSRGSSPSPRPTYKSQRSSRKTSNESSPVIDYSDSSLCNRFKGEDRISNTSVKIKFTPSHSYRYREGVESLENEIDARLRKQNLIGKVLENRTFNKNMFIKRTVNFSWQRGIKIGQGRFGKVYTAVNNLTGDMMAVKEILLQHNDNMTMKMVAEEMKILEGIVHKNLVRYYGLEVHKDEMLIFMEYCSEGTLESLIAASEGGLSELLVRRYSFQLVSGVACLHEHGIVHRDIKTANIFLTDEGNCMKIGDFGCAAKIKSNVTMPGELKGFVGTQAYMAPEVFTKNMSEGHGRAADIWSVGCVVVEMASGKRPWAQYDSNFQIMFKVGMGQSPNPPDDMIDEGLDFLDMCFKHDPKERATARELLAHNFVKVGEDLI